MARGSWRRRWPAPVRRRSSASPWASAISRASTTGTVSSSSPWSTSSGPGRQPAGGVERPVGPQLAGPAGRTWAGSAGVADGPDLAGVLEEPARLAGPVVEVGPGATASRRPDPRVVGGHAHGERPAGRRAGRARRRRARPRRPGGRSAARRSSLPAGSEKSPSLSPQPRNVNVIAAQPISWPIRSISSGNVPADWRASSGPTGKPWQNTKPGRGPVVPGGRAGTAR